MALVVGSAGLSDGTTTSAAMTMIRVARPKALIGRIVALMALGGGYETLPLTLRLWCCDSDPDAKVYGYRGQYTVQQLGYHHLRSHAHKRWTGNVLLVLYPSPIFPSPPPPHYLLP